MGQRASVELDLPKDWRTFRLPPALDRRLQELLDCQDRDGCNHWPSVMSMALAGGGFRHGQVIGATEKDGGRPKERPVTPGDLAATIYHHFGVSRETVYVDPTGRPIPVVQEDGRAQAEFV